MSQKYAIAKNRGVDAFFTKSSSYDRPQWVVESAASTFHSVEAAEAAAKKLYRHGAYEARVVELKEAIQLELPDDEVVPPVDPLAGELDDPENAGYPEDDGKPKMVAQVQTTSVELPAYSDQVDADGDSVNDEVDFDDPLASLEDGQERPNEFADEDDAVDPSTEVALTPLPQHIRRESVQENVVLPTRPADAQNTDLKDTVHDVAKAGKITYKDPGVDVNQTPAVAGAAEDRIAVPANVKSELSAAIASFKKQAEFATKIDDTRGSFCLTVVAAFERLQELLNTGTVESLKHAQVFMMTWMNAITTNLPQSVQYFVTSGGRTPTLKNLFDKAWDAKRAELQ